MRRWISFLGILALPISLSAISWVPSPCPDGMQKAKDDFRGQMRRSQPHSPIYLPLPYPGDDQGIVEDFRFSYFKAWGKGDNLPEDERNLYDALASDSVSYRIVRVEDWTHKRCVLGRASTFHYLILITDKSGVEIARASINESGHMAAYYAFLEHDRRRPLLSSDRVRQTVKARYGIDARDLQFVEIAGTMRCHQLWPCVAFKGQERTYIWKDYDLFELLPGVPAFTNEEVVARRLRGKSLNDYSASERLISVGFDRFAVIRKRVSR